MQKHEIFNWLALAFSAVAYVFYIVPILRKKETTTLSTWMSWFVMDSAVLVAMIDEHKVAYQLIAYSIGCVAVMLAAWKVGAASGWSRVDSTCTVLVILAAALWGVTGGPGLAVAIELFAMSIGSIPLFIHFWESPKPISPWPWLGNLVGAAFAIPAVTSWDVVGAAAPVTFLILSVIFNTAVLRTHRNSKFWSKVLLID